MSRMSICKKMAAVFAATILVVVGMATAFLYSVSSLSGELRIATELTAKKVFLLSELEGQLFRMRSCQRGVMLFAIDKLPEKVRSNKEEFETRGEGIADILREVKPLLVSEQGRKDVEFIENELPKFRGYFEQVAAAAMANDSNGALKIYDNSSNPSLTALDAAAHDLIILQKDLMKQGSERGAQASSRAHWMAYILLLAAVAVLPLAVRMVLETTRKLRAIAADLGEGVQQISSASGQVASSSQALAQGASEQAASLEETSSSSQEITSMTQKNAENSQSAATVMAEVDQNVQAGNRTLEEMVVSMREITASSDKISKIIKVIDEIAFQTNILALNAAVEAARAGEAGMGFAVVADEVRNLAQRSAQAAKDTAALIEESIGKSNEGSAKLERVAEVIRSITSSASRVKTLVDEVNLGSQEQARGIQQISKALEQMDQVTQTTAASAEESASASEEMSAQAEALHQIVTSLRSLVGGEDDQIKPLAKVNLAREMNAAAARPPRVQSVKKTVASIPLEEHFVEM